MPLHRDVTMRLAETREVVRERAVASGGVFRRTDLRGWGVSDDDLAAMRRRGWWTRVHHGVYVDADLLAGATPPARHLLMAAAGIAALSEPAYAYAATAATLFGHALPDGLTAWVQLVRPPSRDGRALRRRVSADDRIDAVEFHTRKLGPDDVTVVDGIPTVNRAIAAVTAAARCDPDWATAVLDSAAWTGVTSIDDLMSTTEAFGHVRGIGVVRRSLPDVRTGAQTPLETFSRLRLIRCGLPEPALQAPLHDSHGLIGYVDMLWADLGVVGEADGMVKYGADPSVIVAEKLREDRIRSTGYAVVRWTWAEMMRTPSAVAARVRRASTWSARRVG